MTLICASNYRIDVTACNIKKIKSFKINGLGIFSLSSRFRDRHENKNKMRTSAQPPS